MKFDFCIGNPPYQEEVTEGSNQAKPVYDAFVEEAKKICDKSFVMITPSRWFSGGMGLDAFRQKMLSENKLKRIVEYTNGKECFPHTSISGGVSVLVWDKEYNGPCTVTNVMDGTENSMARFLNEYEILVRDNSAIGIIRKIKMISSVSLQDSVSVISPFGISTKIRGDTKKKNDDDLKLFSSQGTSFIPRNTVNGNNEYVDVYKVMVSQTSAEHAGEPSKDGKFRVLTSSMQLLCPGEVCTHSYIVIGKFDSLVKPSNIIKYLKTKFVRYLVLQAISSIHISKTTFSFVPEQDFGDHSDIDWSQTIEKINVELYKKYNLTSVEIKSIESKIKEME